MSKYFNEEGEEVTLLSEEDTNAKIEEVKTELNTKFDAEKEESNKKMGVLESDLETAKKAVTDAEAGGAAGESEEDKKKREAEDPNNAALRKKVEDATSALEDEKKVNAEKWEKQENENKETMFDKLANGDEELKKKIEFNYNETLSGVKATTAKEIQEKAATAFKLASGGEAPANPLDSVIAGGTAGHNQSSGNQDAGNTEFTSKDVAMGANMGISDEDRSKYAKDPRMKE